jgi:ribosomal protein S18 acetylase RimI-like enzyme
VSNNRPLWLNDHPQDLIFKLDLKPLSAQGQVWYRKIDSGFEIDYIEIPDLQRGKGLGIKLLNSFIEFCKIQIKNEISKKEKNTDALVPHQLVKNDFEIWLEVSDLNLVAIKTYKACGFKTVGSRPQYYSDGSSAILMTWVLASN